MRASTILMIVQSLLWIGPSEARPLVLSDGRPLYVSELNTWARSAMAPHLGEALRIPRQSISLEGLQLTLEEEGVVFPILHGGAPKAPAFTAVTPAFDPLLQAEEEVIGFVWLGEGRVEADLTPSRSGAWLAGWHHEVLKRKASAVEDLATGRLVGEARAVVAYGSFPALKAAVRGLPTRGGATRRARAKELLELHGPSRRNSARVRLRDEILGLEPAQIPAQVAVLTDRRLGLVVPEVMTVGREKTADSWLVWSYNPEWRYAWTLLSAGQAPGENKKSSTIVRAHWSEDSGARPRPPGGVDAVDADITYFAEPSWDELYLEFRAEATLRLRARERLQYFALTLPTSAARPDSSVIEEVVLSDGTNVLFSPHPQGKLDDSYIDVVLPRPVEAGTEFRVELTWRGTWDYTADVGMRQQEILPSPRPQLVGNSLRYTARVGVPSKSGLDVALSGPTTHTWVDGASTRWTEVRAESPSLFPAMTIGKWTTKSIPPAGEVPAILVRLHPKQEDHLPSFAGEIHNIVSYFQSFLSPYPFKEIELAQIPTTTNGVRMSTADGLITVYSGHYVETKDYPRPVSYVLALSLAYGWFGHLVAPANHEDTWIKRTFSSVLSCSYLSAAYGIEACQNRMESAAREAVNSKLHTVSLTRSSLYRSAEFVQSRYGLYLIHFMLRARVSDTAYTEALQLLTNVPPGHPTTTADVQAAFEQTSGQDLVDFFDFWVWDGFLPEDLVVKWWPIETEGGWFIEGTATADAPFGTFDVQLQIRDAEFDYHTPWITLERGEGTFRLGPFPGSEAPIVRLDPANLTLCRGKRLRRVRVMGPH